MSTARPTEFDAGYGDSSNERRHKLLRGLYLHLAIFLAGVLVMFLMNSSTRGPDGDWWIIWPIQMWSIAWGFHLWGVALGTEALKARD